MSDPLLEVSGLRVSYQQRLDTPGATPAVDGVSFVVRANETLGIVGESGSGKSTIALAIARSLPETADVAGSVRLGDTDVLALDGAALRRWWRDEFALVYQEPTSALNPTMRVGRQIEEVLRSKGASRQRARDEAMALLARVAIPDPAASARRYPHQLSGGQQQRVVIAMALAVRPRLLVLDEPTTGLDATVEREILRLIAGLRSELGAAVLFITHDLGLVDSMCERVAVVHRGRIVEHGDVPAVMTAPEHDYTQHLVASTLVAGQTKPPAPPPLEAAGSALRSRSADPLVEVVGLTKRYGDVTALDDVSLRIGHGEVVGLVGESGSGKTTLGRAIVGLTRPDAGAVLLGGAPMPSELRHRTPEVRRSLQMVFQSPHDTLNPRQRVRQVLARAARKLRGRSSVEQLAASCRLDPSLLDQLASTLSGGQKQRVAIARAIAGDAPLIVCDEPVSSLDVSVQAAILDLLVELQREHGVSLLFVSHDLAVVGYVAERVAVMYAGRIVEEGPTAAVLRPPHHPYTAELVSARQASSIDAPHTPCAPDEVSWSGRDWATGCAFVGRCPSAIPGTCDVESPPVRLLADDRSIRCHLDLESPSREQALGASMSRS